jgi:DNA replication ATP-dependent helicase Dna2
MLMALAEKYPESVAQLTIQYRMHQNICELSNIIAYEGKLKCANQAIALQTLDFKSSSLSVLETSKQWLRQTLDPSRAVIFMDTDKSVGNDDNGMESFQAFEHTIDRRDGGSIVNTTEAQLVRLVVDSLLDCGLDASSIGVISPFRAQLRLLNEKHGFGTKSENKVEISTIDRFQGRDKDVVIISFVRSNAKGKVGKLLQDFRRLNVAVSRAKCKVVMIGSFSTLYKGSDVLRPVLALVRDNKWIVKIPNETT